jgi:polysaccharide export outer membrane protein
MRKIILLSALVTVCFFPFLGYSEDYIVGEGDVLKITVYEHADLITTARVTGEGNILFPLIGELAVDGLTVAQIGEKIAAQLADGYIVDPQVAVFIEEFRSKRTVVMGEIENPGLYVLHGQTTFLELLSKAGGLTKDAGDSALVKRKTTDAANGEHAIIIDLKRLIKEGDITLDVPIMDGDNVYIAKAGVFYATGEVERPNAYKYEPGLTVVKAITKAGGFTDKASPGRVKIMRIRNGKEEILEKVKMDEPVLSDDVIIVPESFF